MSHHKKKPQILAHYTTAAGLVGIFNADNIRASSALFMNDLMEVGFGIDASCNIIASEFRNDDPNPEWTEKDTVDELREFFSGWIVEWNIPFVASFCMHKTEDERKDGILSMWRSYSDSEGYCIEFDFEIVQAIYSPEHAQAPAYTGFDHVSYGKVAEPRARRIGEVCASLRSRVRQLGVRRAFDISDDNEHRKTVFELTREVTLASGFTKHAAFESEREWRIIRGIPKALIEDKYKVGFLDRRNTLIPVMGVAQKIVSRAAKAVIVGPSSGQDTKAEGIELFLRANGYSRIAVRRSSIPFRPS